jgi:hypothetical protein
LLLYITHVPVGMLQFSSMKFSMPFI